ncbi:MAG: murein hydrolase activator EnvC [Phormidesmis sp.]
MSSARVTPAQAQTPPTLEQLRQQRDQIDQQLDAQKEIDERYQKAEKQTDKKLKDLSKSIQGTDTSITNTEYRLASAQQRLNQLEAELENNQAIYEQARTAVVGRLQFMQRQQGAQGWALLLQSDSLNGFLDRRHRLKQVYVADRKMLVALDAQSAEILVQQAGVEQQKNDVSLLRQQLLASRAQYTEQLQQQSVTMERLRDNRGALAAAIQRLDQDSDKVTELILERVAAANAAEAKIAREEALRAARNSGKMLKPSMGPITSNFGSRFHPVLGYSRFHAGTDFGAAHGSPIQAAETGVVIFSGWYGGYGNAVIVEHGDGLTTLYAHASRLNVKEGAIVKKGDAIAAIGTTGLSTGPHLHFEVRRNGEPVDPMQFL